MVQYQESIICDGCGVEVTWSPVKAGNRQFCCEDCQQGKPCNCGNRIDEEDERRDNIEAAIDSSNLM